MTKYVKKLPLTFTFFHPYNGGVKWLKVVESGGLIQAAEGIP